MMFDRLINVEKGVISTRNQKIRVSHNKSQQMDVTITPWSEEECWIVQSENKESIGYYELRILDRNCRCKLRCDKCNICIDYYSCTCHDYLIRSNLCKHVHYLCKGRVAVAVAVAVAILNRPKIKILKNFNQTLII